MTSARPLLLGMLIAVGTLSAPPALGVDFEIQSRTIGDIYAHLRADDQLGDDPIARQRIHQLLGFNAWDLMGDGTNSLVFVSNMRVDSDLGILAAELDNNGQLGRHDVSLMYGYLEARDIGGWLDLKLGRQYEVDAIDMLLFDGLKVRAETPWYFAVELLGGLEAINGTGTINQQALDGSIEGNPNPCFDDVCTGYDVEDPMPRMVIGLGLSLIDLTYTQLDLKFREIVWIGPGVGSDGSEQGYGDNVSQMRVGGSFSQRITEGLFVHGGASYDMYLSLLNEVRGGVRYRPIHMVEVEAGYTYVIPTFDANSIWNFFSWRPINRIEERARFFFGDDLWIHAGAYQSLYSADDTVTLEDVDAEVMDLGMSAGATWIVGRQASVRTDITSQRGFGGDQTFVDLGGSYTFMDGKLGLDARALLIMFESDEQSNLHLNGTMFGGQLGAHWEFHDDMRLNLLLEEATTEVRPVWLRVMAVVDIRKWM